MRKKHHDYLCVSFSCLNFIRDYSLLPCIAAFRSLHILRQEAEQRTTATRRDVGEPHHGQPDPFVQDRAWERYRIQNLFWGC